MGLRERPDHDHLSGGSARRIGPPWPTNRTPNYTRMYRYADLDALIELWGHIRASNPELTGGARLSVRGHRGRHVQPPGRARWGRLEPGQQAAAEDFSELPVSQVEVSDLETGEIFKASGPRGRGD